MGTATWEVRRVLEGLGYRTFSKAVPTAYHEVGKPRVTITFAQWLRQPRDMETAYILDVGHHWVVVKGRWFCDTFVKGVPVRASKAPHRRKRVKEVWQVVRR